MKTNPEGYKTVFSTSRAIMHDNDQLQIALKCVQANPEKFKAHPFLAIAMDEIERVALCPDTREELDALIRKFEFNGWIVEDFSDRVAHLLTCEQLLNLSKQPRYNIPVNPNGFRFNPGSQTDFTSEDFRK